MSELHDRVERGVAIAAAPHQIELVTANVWSVRSQSGEGVYLVTLQGARWKCMCPDFIGVGYECKHIVAVRVFTRGISVAEARAVEARRPRPTYPQKWPEYRRAQRAELEAFPEVLAALLEGLEDPLDAKPTGRPRLPFRDLLFCTMEKIYQGLPLGLAHGLNDRLRAEGKVEVSPSRNMASVLLRSPELTRVLHRLVAASAYPLAGVEEAFAVDSSGFCTTLRGDYCREKYGGRVHTVWQKAHIIVGTATHCVIGVVITGPHGADVTQFKELVRQAVDAGFTLGEVSADRAYLAFDTCQAVVDAGGTPFMIFKNTNHGRRSHRGWPSPAWKHMWYSFTEHPTEFWEHYLKRENVESVISAIKRKLGEKLRSRDLVAQINELLCKIIAYNITVLIHEAFERGVAIPGGPKPVAAAIRDSPSASPHPTADQATTVGSKPDWSGVNN